jgi:hypothetical protein
MSETQTCGPIRGKWPGVAAIDVDGGRYCLDCAKTALDGRTVGYQDSDGSWHTAENADGERIVNDLISGEIRTLGYGGVVLRHETDGRLNHCGACGVTVDV